MNNSAPAARLGTPADCVYACGRLFRAPTREQGRSLSAGACGAPAEGEMIRPISRRVEYER